MNIVLRLGMVGAATLVVVATLRPIVDAIQRNGASQAELRNLANDGNYYISRRDDIVVPYLGGVRAFDAGKFERALHLFAQVPDRHGLTAWFTLRALGETGRWKEALDLADTDVPAERDLFAQIFTLHESELTQIERAHYVQILYRDPESILAYSTRLLSFRRFGEAAEAASVAADSFSDPQERSRALLVAARAQFYLHDWDDARVILDHLVQEFGSPHARYWLGRTRFEQGEIQPGLADVRAAIEQYPVEARPGYIAEYAYLLVRSGQCALGEDILGKAALDPHYAPNRPLLEEALERVRERC